jgi:hypothetical protein
MNPYILIDAAPGVAILVTLEGLVDDAPVLDEHQAAADDAGRLYALAIERLDPRPAVARRLQRDEREDGRDERAKHAYSYRNAFTGSRRSGGALVDDRGFVSGRAVEVVERAAARQRQSRVRAGPASTAGRGSRS